MKKILRENSNNSQEFLKFGTHSSKWHIFLKSHCSEVMNPMTEEVERAWEPEVIREMRRTRLSKST